MEAEIGAEPVDDSRGCGHAWCALFLSSLRKGKDEGFESVSTLVYTIPRITTRVPENG